MSSMPYPMGFNGVDARVVTIDPATAKQMLRHNKKNRHIRQSSVTQYARDMTEGRWSMTGEPVKFDTNGDLADGQHRLLAIIKAQVSVPMLVVWGVPPEAQDVMDSGMKRRASDKFQMAGMKNVSVLAAIARFALIRDYSIPRPTTSEIQNWVEQHEAHATVAAHYSASYKAHIDIPPSVIGYAWLLLSDVNASACEEFFESIAHARTNGPGDPRHALIQRLRPSRSQRATTEALSQTAYLSLVVRAWNAWRQGKTMTRIQTNSPSGPIPVPRPL